MRKLFTLVAFAITLRAQPTDFEGWRDRGLELLRSGKYPEAVDSLQRAEELNPNLAMIHLYLSTAYMQMWIPGARSPENDSFAAHAETEFKRVLELAPNDTTAPASLTKLSYQQAQLVYGDERVRKLQEARDWNSRVLKIDPRNKEGHYWAGVLAWMEFYPAFMTARAAAHMKPEDPGPLPPAAASELLNKYGPLVDDGIKYLRFAIEIDPQYADAMAYLNLLIRERADLRDTPEQYRRDIEEANSWVDRAVKARKLNPQSSQNAPPPPPPPPGAQTQPPQRIRVGGNVQLANLIHKVDPKCPPSRITGQVQLTVIIAKNGQVQDIAVISGDPSLVPTAVDAVKQWVYKPTRLNNNPVEVITQVNVNFNCGH